MFTIAIDLDDVVRNWRNRYIEEYCKEFDRYDIDLEDEEGLKKIDIDKDLTFPSSIMKNKFLYEDYPLEIKGCSKECEKNIVNTINKWMNDLENETEGKVEFMFVSPMEMGATIPSNYFFLSRYNTHVRGIYMPKYSENVWEKCDMLITANERFIKSKKEGKTLIFIAEGKKGFDFDYKFAKLSDAINSEEINNLIKEKANG